MSYLNVKNLSCIFHNKKNLFNSKKYVTHALNNVNFSIKEGEILGLVGESGCGKSTLSRIILQFIKPTSGFIKLRDNIIISSENNLNSIKKNDARFQMIFQDPYSSLNPRMTVFKILSESILSKYANLKKDKLKLVDRVVNFMDMVGLDSRDLYKYPHEFSGGQKQRIAIARSISIEPELLIADEPISALDVSIQSQILNLLIELQKKLNITMLFISHDLSAIRHISNRVIVMNKGEIIEEAETEELFKNPKSDITKKLINSIPKINI